MIYEGVLLFGVTFVAALTVQLIVAAVARKHVLERLVAGCDLARAQYVVAIAARQPVVASITEDDIVAGFKAGHQIERRPTACALDGDGAALMRLEGDLRVERPELLARGGVYARLHQRQFAEEPVTAAA